MRRTRKLLGRMYIGAASMESRMEVPQKKPKLEPPQDPATPLLGIHPEKTVIPKDTCTPLAPAAPLTAARAWRQPECPPAEGRTEITEHYSATPRKETAPLAQLGTDVEAAIQ